MTPPPPANEEGDGALDRGDLQEIFAFLFGGFKTTKPSPPPPPSSSPPPPWKDLPPHPPPPATSNDSRTRYVVTGRADDDKEMREGQSHDGPRGGPRAGNHTELATNLLGKVEKQWDQCRSEVGAKESLLVFPESWDPNGVRPKLAKANRLLRQILRACTDTVETDKFGEFSSGIWSMFSHLKAQVDLEDRFKQAVAEGDTFGQMTLILRLVGDPTRGANPAERNDIFEADAVSLIMDMADAGASGPSTSEATSMLINCLNAKDSLDACIVPRQWTMECQECEERKQWLIPHSHEQDEDDELPSYVLPVAIAGTAMLTFILTLAIGFHCGSVSAERRIHSNPSAGVSSTAQLPSGEMVEIAQVEGKAVASKADSVESIEACKHDAPLKAVDYIETEA